MINLSIPDLEVFVSSEQDVGEARLPDPGAPENHDPGTREVGLVRN